MKRFFVYLSVLLLVYPILLAHANETTTTTTTSTTTTTTTTTIPGEVEEIETFDGTTTTTTIPDENVTTTTTTTIPDNTTTTTTVPETWEQSTDIVLPEDEIDSQGNEIENNIQIDDKHSNGNWSCCGMTDFHMNLHYFQHGNDSNDYTFDLPDEHDIYEVGFRIGALNNDGTVTYVHTDETTQENILEGQDNTDIQNMFEDVVYNIYDTLETFIDSFTITINDWSLLDDISFKYVTTTTTTTTTTIYIPPPPDPEPEPIPGPEVVVVILESGEEAEYQQHEIDDGTVERDNQRDKNFIETGLRETDIQRERREEEERLQNEEENEIGDEFFEGDDEILQIPDDYEVERDLKQLEYEEEIEIFTFESEQEIEEFIDTIIEVEEFLEEFEEVEIIIIEDIEDLEINLDIENIVIPEKEEDFDDWDTEFEEIEEQIIIEILPEEVTEEEYEEIIEKDVDDLTEEEVEIVVEITEKVIEEVVELDVLEEEIEIIDQEEYIELSEEEQEIYEEELTEKIEEIVEELEVEELVTVVEQVESIGVETLETADIETVKVVQAVVVEIVEEVDSLSDEEVEIVANVLGFGEEEDVKIISEIAKEDQQVEEALDTFVERKIENSKDSLMPYTLSDSIVEVQVEQFLENPIETLVNVDLSDITISKINSGMSSDQKEKSQEVVVPTILVRIASMFSMAYRRNG